MYFPSMLWVWSENIPDFGPEYRIHSFEKQVMEAFNIVYQIGG